MLRLFDYRVNEETSAKLIAGLTDAPAATHEGLRDHTWVIVEGHDPKNWGHGCEPRPQFFGSWPLIIIQVWSRRPRGVAATGRL